jgi:hypothetical protein
LFAAPLAELVSGEFPTIQTDAMGGLHLPFPPSSRIRYSVTSHVPQLDPDLPRRNSFPLSSGSHGVAKGGRFGTPRHPTDHGSL